MVVLWILGLEGGTDKQDRHRSQINPLTVLHVHDICSYLYIFVCVFACVFDREAARDLISTNVCGDNINLPLVSSFVGSPSKSVSPQPAAIG